MLFFGIGSARRLNVTVALGISIVNCDAGLYRYVWNQVDTVSHVDMDLDRNSAVCTRMPQSHTAGSQTGFDAGKNELE